MKKLNIRQDNANEVVVTLPTGERHLYSYTVLIAVITAKGIIKLSKNYWDYSVTTARHRNAFLGISSKEVKAKVESKEYKLVVLN